MYMRATVSIIGVEATKKLIPCVFSHYSLSSHTQLKSISNASYIGVEEKSNNNGNQVVYSAGRQSLFKEKTTILVNSTHQ